MSSYVLFPIRDIGQSQSLIPKQNDFMCWNRKGEFRLVLPQDNLHLKCISLWLPFTVVVMEEGSMFQQLQVTSFRLSDSKSERKLISIVFRQQVLQSNQRQQKQIFQNLLRKLAVTKICRALYIMHNITWNFYVFGFNPSPLFGEKQESFDL